MTWELHPAGVSLLLLMGLVGYVTLYHLWLWLLRRAEVLNLWVAMWSATTLLYLVSRYLQVTAAAPEQAVLAGRVAWVSGLVLVPNLIGLVRELASRPCSRRLLVGLGAADLVLLTLVWFTPAVIADSAYLRRDALGSEYWAPVPGPLMPLLVPSILLVFAYGLVTLWRARSLDRSERRALLIGFATYAAMGIHDILHATRLIQSVQIFHWGFVAVALGLNYLLVRRFTRLAQNLESEVATRTRELESRGDQLAALVQSGHSLMGGLPLQAILERIMREASRIAKTPHILVFLMDREASVLRLAASSERLVAPGLEAPLGTSLSGRVATTGRPLFVPDTRNDPRSLLTEQNREAGIVTYLGLPITLRERALGVLVFNTEAPREYAPEEISYLSAFADQAALAIESARLYEALETRVQRTETLTRLNRLISSSLDVDHVLREIAGAATQVTGAALAIVWAADENRRVVEARAGSDEKLLAEHPNPSLRFGEGIAGWVAENRQPLAVADLGPDQRSVSRRWFLEHGFKSGMAVPIVHGESLLGVLSLVGREKFRLSPEDEALLGSLVDQAAIAVNNGKLYQALEARLDRVRTLTRLNQMISRSLDRDRVLGEIASAAAQVMAAPVVSFWMADEAARTLALVGFSDPAAEEDWPHQTLTFDEGVIGWVASHRLRLSVANAFEDGRFMALAWWRAHGLSSFLGVPVVIDGALVAVLALNGREPFRLGPDDETLLESFVAQATVAIRNALLYAAEAAARRAAERTLAEVKQLQGLLPICAYCKKIRNDKNYWEQLESYIGERSGAQFSHGICPECSATVVARQLEEWRRTR